MIRKFLCETWFFFLLWRLQFYLTCFRKHTDFYFSLQQRSIISACSFHIHNNGMFLIKAKYFHFHFTLIFLYQSIFCCLQLQKEIRSFSVAIQQWIMTSWLFSRLLNFLKFCFEDQDFPWDRASICCFSLFLCTPF